MSKKSAAHKTKEETTYQSRDIVLAKLKGYPAWPGQVVDPDTVAKDVLKERPLGKKSNFYCVRFFPIGDHAWMQAKDLSRLQLHEIQAYINEPHKKSGDLLRGYQIALNPDKWMQDLEDARRAMVEEMANQSIDQLEPASDEEEQPKEVKLKKRKREPSKKSTSKEPKETSKAKSKRKNGGKKSNAMVESEDEGGDAGPSSKSAPPAKKAKLSKEVKDENHDLDNDPEAIKVKDMRHKIQRAFLSKLGPKAEEMEALDKVFNEVEEYGMTIQYLQHSKIGKVMRHISVLEVDKIPQDDEFKFRDRAQALVNRWHTTVNNAGEGAKALNGKANGAPVPDSAVSEGVMPPSGGLDTGIGAGDLTMDTTLGDVMMASAVTE